MSTMLRDSGAGAYSERASVVVICLMDISPG